MADDLKQYRGKAPTVDGMFPGESIAEAARSWAGWCEHRSLTGLPSFLRKVAELAEGAVKRQPLDDMDIANIYERHADEQWLEFARAIEAAHGIGVSPTDHQPK